MAFLVCTFTTILLGVAASDVKRGNQRGGAIHADSFVSRSRLLLKKTDARVFNPLGNRRSLAEGSEYTVIY